MRFVYGEEVFVAVISNCWYVVKYIDNGVDYEYI